MNKYILGQVRVNRFNGVKFIQPLATSRGVGNTFLEKSFHNERTYTLQTNIEEGSLAYWHVTDGSISLAKNSKKPVVMINLGREISLEKLQSTGLADEKLNLKGVTWIIGEYEANLFKGFLIESNMLEKRDDRFYLREQVFSLKEYTLRSNLELELSIYHGNDRPLVGIYGDVNLPENYRIRNIRSWRDIFNKAIPNIINNKAMGKMGLLRKERAVIRKFFDEMNHEDIISQLEEETGELSEVIQNELNQYLKESKLRLELNDENTQLLIKIACQDERLVAKIEQEVRNTVKPRIEAEFSHIKEQILKSKAQLKEITNKFEETTELHTELNHNIEEKKKINNSEELLSKKLREEVAIAKDELINIKEKIKQAKLEKIISLKGDNAYSQGESMSKVVHVEEADDVEDFIYNLADCLPFVVDSYAEDVAALLWGSLQSFEPLLLVGPMSEEIIQVLSLYYVGRRASILDLKKDFSEEVFNNDKEEIIIVRNLFEGNQINFVSQLKAHKNKHFYVVASFKEDLLIEPNSLYSYLSPILTEDFIKETRFIDESQVPYFPKAYKLRKVEFEEITLKLTKKLPLIVKEKWIKMSQVDFYEEEILKFLKKGYSYVTQDEEFR